MSTEVAPGRYRHYKGKEYRVYCVGRMVDGDQLVVIYHPVNDPNTVWVRSLDEWLCDAFLDGIAVPRFTRIEET